MLATAYNTLYVIIVYSYLILRERLELSNKIENRNKCNIVRKGLFYNTWSKQANQNLCLLDTKSKV